MAISIEDFIKNQNFQLVEKLVNLPDDQFYHAFLDYQIRGKFELEKNEVYNSQYNFNTYSYKKKNSFTLFREALTTIRTLKKKDESLEQFLKNQTDPKINNTIKVNINLIHNQLSENNFSKDFAIVLKNKNSLKLSINYVKSILETIQLENKLGQKIFVKGSQEEFFSAYFREIAKDLNRNDLYKVYRGNDTKLDDLSANEYLNRVDVPQFLEDQNNQEEINYEISKQLGIDADLIGDPERCYYYFLESAYKNRQGPPGSWQLAGIKFQRYITDYSKNPHNSVLAYDGDIEIQKIKYTEMILESIKKNTNLDSISPNIHAKNRKIFEEMMKENPSLKNVTATEFLQEVEYLFEETFPDETNYNKYKNNLLSFNQGYQLYKILPPIQKKLLETSMRTPQPVPSYNNVNNTQPPQIGISMDNTNITDIKAKFESALRDINDADKIKEFTTVRPVNESGKAYYKTQITDNNDQKIDVKISKDGSKSYLDGNFNEDSYKILIETFVRTHNITDTNQLQALNIPQQHIAKANEIIEEVINDYTNQNQIGLSMNNEM